MNATLVKALEGLPKKLQDHVLARYEKAAAEQRAEAPAYESVLEELYAKRDELLRSRPEFTEAQAFDKVYLDPANRELMMREKEERLAKISGRAHLPQPTGAAATVSTRGVQGSQTYDAATDGRRPGTARASGSGGPQSGPEPQPTVTSHYEEFQRLAGALRKVKPELTEAQAFTKVFEDSANRDLRRGYADEEQRRLMNMAAM